MLKNVKVGKMQKKQYNIKIFIIFISSFLPKISSVDRPFGLSTIRNNLSDPFIVYLITAQDERIQAGDLRHEIHIKWTLLTKGFQRKNKQRSGR